MFYITLNILREVRILKKGETFDLLITGIYFKGYGVGEFEGEKFFVKDAVPFEKLKVRFIKKKSSQNICKIVEKIEDSPLLINPVCEKFKQCGGCTYLNLEYKHQIEFKTKALLDIFEESKIPYERFEGIVSSPNQFGYRNKMEFSFGDEVKGGQLELGLHKKFNPFSIVPTYTCHLVSEDFRKIITFTADYFRSRNVKAYKLKNHEGYLRNLILREGKDEILICLVTSIQENFDLDEFKDEILKLDLDKNVGGIINVVSDSLSDAINPKEIKILHGKDYIYEEIFGLKFKINLFSFFQTNTEGMKLLYKEVVDNVKNVDGILLDLYCGIGTIGQVLSSKLKNKVIGIEIVKEAVKMAKENAILNNLDCEFIEGDVVQTVGKIKDKIDFIIVDPPRSGIGEKGVRNICKFNLNNIIYVSCNPKTLIEDLKTFLEYGYKIKSIKGIDMFANTYHVECVVLLSKVQN